MKDVATCRKVRQREKEAEQARKAAEISRMTEKERNEYEIQRIKEKIKEMNPKGIILTGGPNSCYLADSPTYSKELFELGIPVLGLCYGAQLMQHVLGGKVERADVREYGKSILLVDNQRRT